MSKTLWIVNPFEPLPKPGVLRGRYGDLLEYCDTFDRVVWWTADFDHWTKLARIPVPDSSNVEYRKLKVRPYKSNVSFQRILSHRDFGKAFEQEAGRLLKSNQSEPPTHVLIGMPPLGVLAHAKALLRRTGAKIVLDVNDPWPDAFAQFLPVPRCLRALVGRAFFAPLSARARADIRTADAITAVSQTYLDWALAKRQEPCPAEVFRLGSALSSQVKGEPPAGDRKAVFRVVYSGSLSGNYDLKTVLLAAQLLVVPYPRLRFAFAGRGADEADLKDTAKRLGLEDTVEFHGYLGSEELWQLLGSSRLGLNSIRPGSLISLPNKVGDYLYTGLPIINSVSGELEAYLQQHDCGSQYEAGNAASLASAIQRYLDNPSLREQQSRQAIVVGQKDFSRPQILKAFAAFLSDLAT